MNLPNMFPEYNLQTMSGTVQQPIQDTETKTYEFEIGGDDIAFFLIVIFLLIFGKVIIEMLFAFIGMVFSFIAGVLFFIGAVVVETPKFIYQATKHGIRRIKESGTTEKIKHSIDPDHREELYELDPNTGEYVKVEMEPEELDDLLGEDYDDRRIVCAANIHPNGDIMLGIRHVDQFMIKHSQELDDAYGSEFDVSVFHLPDNQGFVDQRGQWYNRQEAWKIAKRQGQIIRRVGGDEYKGGTLFSENLY